MANLNETDEWFDGVYQLEEDDPVLGGPAGIDNLAPRQLASRSRYQRLRNVTPWAAALAYPADVAYVSHGNTTWKSVAASTGVEPGTDETKWVRWAHTASELTNAVGDAVAAHEAKPDPHPQYATELELNAHAAASDPHTGYVPWGFAAAVATAAGLVPDRALPSQLAQAIPLLAPGRLIARRVFTATQIYTPTPGTKSVNVTVIGGGGAGGGAIAGTGANQCSAGCGGGAGGFALKRITSGFAGVTITVGAGGAGTPGIAGTAGGSSSFGGLLSATGGAGGIAGGVGGSNTASFNGSAAGGQGFSGDVNGKGGMGVGGFYAPVPIGGQGGSSFFGGGAGIVSGQSGGQNAANTSPGAGGGGGSLPAGIASGDATGGAGAVGAVIVEEYS